jgi:hypothetical protein
LRKAFRTFFERGFPLWVRPRLPFGLLSKPKLKDARDFPLVWASGICKNHFMSDEFPDDFNEEFDEKEKADMHQEVGGWFDAFVDSSQYEQLTEFQQGEAGAVF